MGRSLRSGTQPESTGYASTDYLEFKARGSPRLLLAGLNALVRWDGEMPFLELDAAAQDQAGFYCEVQRSLAVFLSRSAETGLLLQPFDHDRWWLMAHLAVDWVLRSDGTSFTPNELLAAIAPADEVTTPDHTRIGLLLEHLTAGAFLELARAENSPFATRIGDVPHSQEPFYRLAGGLKQKLRHLSHSPQPDTPTDPPLSIPSIRGLSNFEIKAEIGRGGMGRVYRAVDRATEREVAIKVLSGPLARDPAMRSRFGREATLAQRLNHPNLVRTYAVLAEDEGDMAIVMQYLSGELLTEAIEAGRLTPTAAVGTTRQILDAVSYVAEHGLVRLDLKPSNVILEPDGRPVIVDFGLLKPSANDEARQQDDEPIITQVGLFVGTIHYAAPEQVEGKRLDIRADIYSVGVVLYEMLAHRRPHEGEGPSLLRRIVSEPVDVSDLDVSDALRSVLTKACAIGPEERFSTPAEMAAALAQTPEMKR